MNIALKEVCFDRNDLRGLKGAVVCEIADGAEDDGSEFVLISFFNTEKCELIQLRMDSNGRISISDPQDY